MKNPAEIELQRRQALFIAWRDRHRQIPTELRQEWIQDNLTNANIRRANEQQANKVTFDLEKRSKENFSKLRKRLQDLEGPLTDEMKKTIESRRIPGRYLTPEEKIIAEKLIHGTWTLKHATPATSYEAIKKSGDQLLSLAEQEKRGKIATSHTSRAEGHKNNIFFTFGPGEVDSVRFLDDAEVVISVDYHTLLEREPNALYGAWVSDHFYAYTVEQNSEPLVLYDVRYIINYRKIVDPHSGAERWVKIRRFEHANGLTTEQIIEKGDEIFQHPLMHRALVLLVIETARLLGKKAWEEIMQIQDLSQVQRLVNTIYHAGFLEVHKAGRFSLNQPGVRVITRSNPRSIAFTPTSNREIIKAALQGQRDIVLTALANGRVALTDFIHIPNRCVLNLFEAAILGGNVLLVEALLQQPIDLNNTRYRTYLHLNDQTIDLPPILCAVLLSCPKIASFLLEDEFSSAEVPVKQNAEQALTMIKLLCELGSVNQANRQIRQPLLLEEDHLVAAIRYFRPEPAIINQLLHYANRITPEALPLIWAVAGGYEQAVRWMLSGGADINARFSGEIAYKGMKNFLQLPQGCTPLLAAILTQNPSMVDLLIAAKADLNLPFSYAATESPCRVPIYEGHTPMMLATQCNNLAIMNSLRQAGVPHIQTQEINRYPQYRIHDYKDIYILTGVNERGTRLFLIGDSMKDSSIMDRLFSFMSITAGIAKELIFERLNRLFNMDLNLGSITWTELGTIQRTLESDSIHYQIKFIAADLGIISQRLIDHMGTLESETGFFSTEEILDRMQQGKSPKLTYEMAQALARQKHMTALDADFLRQYEKALFDQIALQHQLINSARRGNLKQIQELMARGATLDCPMPTGEDISSHVDEQFEIYPFEAALLGNYFDCALFTLQQTNFEEEFTLSKKLIEKIIMTGQVELLKLLHEKNCKTITGDLISQFCVCAIRNNQHLMLHYLLNAVESKTKHEEESYRTYLDFAAQTLASDCIDLLLDKIRITERKERFENTLGLATKEYHTPNLTRLMPQTLRDQKYLRFFTTLVPLLSANRHDVALAATNCAIQYAHFSLFREALSHLSLQTLSNNRNIQTYFPDLILIQSHANKPGTLALAIEFLKALCVAARSLDYFIPVFEDLKIMIPSKDFQELLAWFYQHIPHLPFLHRAVEQGNVKTLDDLLEQKIPVNAYVFDGQKLLSLLHFSFSIKQFDCALHLIRRGARVQDLSYECIANVISANHVPLFKKLTTIDYTFNLIRRNIARTKEMAFKLNAVDILEIIFLTGRIDNGLRLHYEHENPFQWLNNTTLYTRIAPYFIQDDCYFFIQSIMSNSPKIYQEQEETIVALGANVDKQLFDNAILAHANKLRTSGTALSLIKQVDEARELQRGMQTKFGAWFKKLKEQQDPINNKKASEERITVLPSEKSTRRLRSR